MALVKFLLLTAACSDNDFYVDLNVTLIWLYVPLLYINSLDMPFKKENNLKMEFIIKNFYFWAPFR